MSGRVIVDARNILDPSMAVSEGFIYAGIGTPASGENAAEVAA